ncbi:Major exo-1,3-beta-glucanase of the cell wall, involved in cell wall beta-glucan assembly [Komagataella phaffii GS115]|uniref:Glucan 1,3-beta-glucosidase n=3 Tax=Komagataella TaxID=460517 RepID=C4R0Q7_KOMPG|nr:Major exo-1,3-beta-glucanase of the cell wall, involved in cell wall beta-glucan assembly [Komagataella phaffii GS115]AAY28969.1 exo-beta-1,3-glucanase [Komagataella pastoris]AOA62628.1 GQ67_00497T0 [Komagataella phaffii]AOA67579.1 GQ68_00891T0 [Komagataella phaffii GS115]CAY69081.1 Major exo-1,3-beta-glucanase of the cell wall, involved in cell wall beta-glucan assembly [Komagataella phaffii GS115]
MNLYLITLLFASLCSAITLPKRDIIWDYSSEKIMGVNLGGWLVLEPYITPSLFEAFGDDVPVDEYRYTERLGKSLALDRLQQHWSTFYDEKDFQDIAAYGLNFVRIPIGYWAFQLLDDDPYVQGQEEYLDKALEWSRKHGLKVWIDLHGAPGSQNGFDNSGKRDSWDFQNGNNVQVTLDVLKYISKKYGTTDYYDVVIGIQLLNEPLGPILDMDNLRQFYADGYDLVRDVGNNFVVIHDAFYQAPEYWGDDFTSAEGYWNVVLDHHHYQVFDADELQRSIDEHIEAACDWGRDANKEYHWNLCGEWSAALTDCTPWLNGVGKGTRYEGQLDNSPWIGSCENSQDPSKLSSERICEYRRYVEAQLDAFLHGKSAGFIFWCFKTEASLEWDFKRLVNAGIMPQPLDDRQYPNQCGF